MEIDEKKKFEHYGKIIRYAIILDSKLDQFIIIYFSKNNKHAPFNKTFLENMSTNRKIGIFKSVCKSEGLYVSYKEEDVVKGSEFEIYNQTLKRKTKLVNVYTNKKLKIVVRVNVTENEAYKKLFSDIGYIRQIRNQVAHNPDFIDPYDKGKIKLYPKPYDILQDNKDGITIDKKTVEIVKLKLISAVMGINKAYEKLLRK